MIQYVSACVMLALVMCGCGGSKDVVLIPVTGIVTLNGNPLAGAVVQFHPDGARASFGSTDDQGWYELTYLDRKKGAVVGKHRVVISTMVERDPESSDPQIRKEGRPETIPAQYNSRSILEAELQAGTKPVLNFELESKK